MSEQEMIRLLVKWNREQEELNKRNKQLKPNLFRRLYEKVLYFRKQKA